MTNPMENNKFHETHSADNCVLNNNNKWVVGGRHKIVVSNINSMINKFQLSLKWIDTQNYTIIIFPVEGEWL